MELKRRKSTLRLATMDDFDWINDLFRKKHKKFFNFLREDMLIERIKESQAFISKDKKYSEIIRIYKKKTKIANGLKREIIAKPGDINLLYAASTTPGEGIGTKYRKIFMDQMFSPGRIMFSILHHTNKASATYNEKCNLDFYDEYTKNNHKYLVYVFICRSKNRFLK